MIDWVFNLIGLFNGRSAAGGVADVIIALFIYDVIKRIMRRTR